jgi:hypothetical protein
MSKYTVTIREFSKDELEFAIKDIIEQLKDKDCQKVEFLRGKLSCLYDFLEKNGWKSVERNTYF